MKLLRDFVLFRALRRHAAARRADARPHTVTVPAPLATPGDLIAERHHAAGAAAAHTTPLVRIVVTSP